MPGAIEEFYILCDVAVPRDHEVRRDFERPDLREVGIQQLVHYYGDGVQPAITKGLRHRVGPVVEPRRRLDDPLPRFLANGVPGLRVECPRGGAEGHAGLSRHVGER